MLPFIFFILLTAAAAVFGASFQPGEWYASLTTPSWTPPNWLFGPVWTVLYVMIAVAGWLVWRARGVSIAVVFWGLQITLNAAWSWAMFGQHQIGLALAIILALELSIVAFSVLAWPVASTATWLFLPYLAWVSYAAALNFSIWRLNA